MLSHAQSPIPDNAVRIPLRVYAYDPTSGNDIPRPKAPTQPLVVWSGNGSLFFQQPFNEAVSIELCDADGIVVFSTCVPAGSTTLSLPTSLSGDYTLLLYIGNCCYCGIIHL
jgi:hypothetical protein